jgi:hypothetical protein
MNESAQIKLALIANADQTGQPDGNNQCEAIAGFYRGRSAENRHNLAA